MNFSSFSEHWFGSWVIQGLSVVAFILVLKLLVSRFPTAGIPGAVRGGVSAI